ncbi:MAG: hypothetical protein ACREET_10740 [Stellaceae bacterium]
MPREIVGKGLRFSLRHAPCAHICRYCLISESRKRSTLPFARFEQLVHRFHDWQQSTRHDDLQIGIFVGPSFDYDMETLQGVARLHARRGARFQTVNLGGLRIRSGAALIEWIEERRAAGITGFHTSLAGCGEIHDRWNGRAGDFDYQISILRLAGERGMVRREKLFLTQNTLPIFDRLLDILDGIPGEIGSRSASPFFYAGLATRYESERLTEDDRDRLPEPIDRLRPKRFGTWRSEREWIPIMLETADQPRKLLLKIDVDETTIDYLENASCEEVFAERERQYQESYHLVPALDELCARYGDPENRKIYPISRDVEGRWLDLHEAATGIAPPID